MFINPKTALAEGWIKGIKNPDVQVQPNAIDFTADKAFEVSSGQFYVSETYKQMRGSEPLEPRRTFFEEGTPDAWIIGGGEMIDCLSDVYVDLPEGVAAQLVIRSTLARNGLQLVSGLYDSGFKGHVGFILHNRHHDDATIAQGTRVGQIILIASDSAGTYAGGYNHEAGADLDYQK